MWKLALHSLYKSWISANDLVQEHSWIMFTYQYWQQLLLQHHSSKAFFICILEIIWGFVVEAGITTNCLGKFLFSNAILDRGVALDTIYLNIRWHQTQLLPWDFAYAYVTSGLHTYFSVISISIRKWKRFLSLCLCLCLCHSRFKLLMLTLMFMLVLMLTSQCKPRLINAFFKQLISADLPICHIPSCPCCSHIHCPPPRSALY